MSIRSIFPLITALWLQVAPMMVRLEPVTAALARPIAMLLRWMAGGVAVSGAFHAVSGATGLTVTGPNGVIPTGQPIVARRGVIYPGVKFAINSSQHGIPKSYTFENLPAGLRKAGADTVQGTPTVSGIVSARVIGWKNANASGNFAAFDIQFNIQGAPPVVTLQPISQTVDAGASVTFSVAATGEAPLTYQWFREDLEIAGTQPTLTLSGVTAGQAARYRARVNSPAGATFSDFATLTVNTVFPPAITAQPSDVTVIEGSSVVFSVEATGVGPFSFAWTKDGVAVSPGGTGQVLTLNPARTADAGSYQVQVSNSGGPTFSRAATLTVIPLVAPVITTQPIGQTVNVGAAVALTVVATGTEPLTYTWLKNDLELGGVATNATLNLVAVGTGDSGQYRVRINNAGGFALSEIAQVTVNAAITPPSIVSEPSTITKYVGETVRLGVQVSPGSDGLAPVVTWLKNGVEMPGVLGDGFDLSPLAATDAGQYVARAAGAGGTVFGAPITVVSVPLPVMAATAGPTGLKVAFPVLPGREYRLEGQSAVGGAWTERQVLRPDSSTTEAILPLDSNSGFFRVRVTLLP